MGIILMISWWKSESTHQLAKPRKEPPDPALGTEAEEYTLGLIHLVFSHFLPYFTHDTESGKEKIYN